MASYDDIHKRCPNSNLVCLCPVACRDRGSCATGELPKSHGISPRPSNGDGMNPEVQEIKPHVVIAAHLSTDSQARKETPIATGCLDYFPDALAAVAALSKIGNDKHNPGQPLHWSREKSSDHADCIMRHMIDRGTIDTDGVLHDVKVAWRALAMLQLALEKQKCT